MKKISRNDPCHCASGKKYKLCCMAQDVQLQDAQRRQQTQQQVQINQVLQQALALHREGRLTEARQTYQQVLDADPAHADALHLSGVIAHQQGNYGMAIDLIKRSLQENVGNAYAMNNLGVAMRESGLSNEALQYFVRATEVKPDHAEAYNNIGNVHKDLGQYQEAIIAYQRALTLQPTMLEPWNNLALVYQKQKNITAALECAQRALALNPDLADIHNSLGNIYRDAGRIEDAIASFQRAVTLDPQQSNALHFLNVLSGTASAQAPSAYVAKVFDDYAERFDQHLQQVLQYDIPADLARELPQHAIASAQAWHLLDLGCGTGLVGQALCSHTRAMVGVDLSEKMLLKAQQRQIYQRLLQADLLNAMLQEPEASFDVIVAADVFVYIGQLSAIVEQASRLLSHGGLFAFSTETAHENESESVAQNGYCLRPSGRYAHQPLYLQQLASIYGFVCIQQLPRTIRMENHHAIDGYLTIWRK